MHINVHMASPARPVVAAFLTRGSGFQGRRDSFHGRARGGGQDRWAGTSVNPFNFFFNCNYVSLSKGVLCLWIYKTDVWHEIWVWEILVIYGVGTGWWAWHAVTFESPWKLEEGAEPTVLENIQAENLFVYCLWFTLWCCTIYRRSFDIKDFAVVKPSINFNSFLVVF